MKNLIKFITMMMVISGLVISCQKNDNLNESKDASDLLKKANDCVKIQDGILVYAAGHYLAGQPLTTGYDIFGYNYQAHIYSGSYANVYLGRDGFPPYDGDDATYLAAYPAAENTWYWPYRNDNVLMKWNDAWISNKDCDGDGKLDRHYGFPAYIGSGAWETNHQWGSYYDENGNYCEWDYFCKIIAVPATAVLDNGIWYNEDGVEIGPMIWNDFAIIQEVYNDPCAGYEGMFYISPDHAGFGGW